MKIRRESSEEKNKHILHIATVPRIGKRIIAQICLSLLPIKIKVAGGYV
jgi:DNA-binding winged helix-turn-helix (wHTH) protein